MFEVQSFVVISCGGEAGFKSLAAYLLRPTDLRSIYLSPRRISFLFFVTFHFLKTIYLARHLIEMIEGKGSVENK